MRVIRAVPPLLACRRPYICSALEPEIGFSWGNFSTKHLTEVLLSRLWVEHFVWFCLRAQDPLQPPPRSAMPVPPQRAEKGTAAETQSSSVYKVPFLCILCKGPF